MLLERRHQRLDPRRVRAHAGQQQHVGRWLSWILAIVAVVGYALVQFDRIRSRAARGLVTDPIGIVLLRIGGLAVLVLRRDRAC